MTGDRHGDYLSRLDRWSDIQDQMPFLYQTVAALPFAVVIELGVRSGNSTAALLAGAEAAAGELWSADVNIPDVPATWHEDRRWHFRQGGDLSPEVLAWLPGTADVIFLDTSHEYEHTLAELREFVPRLRPGGVLLAHDTQWEYPAVSLPAPGGPVTGALDAYCGQAGRSWENRASGPGYYGLGIIRA